MKRILNYISSRRFAILLLVITTSVILLSNLLPKPFLMTAQEVDKLRKERPLIYALSAKVGVLGLTRSPYFRVIPVFIFLSVAVCTFRRFRAEIEKGKGGRVVPAELPVRHSISLKPEDLKRDKLISLLKNRGWHLLTKVHENQPHPHLNPLPDGEETPLSPPFQGFMPGWVDGQGGDGASKAFSEQRTVIYGIKGTKGIWGSLGFHTGMNVALIGILISITTGMDGKLLLTEGFPVTTPKEVIGMKGVQDFPFHEMALESFVPVFEGGFPVRYDSKLMGIDRDGRLMRYMISVNSLLDSGDYKFIFGAAGYAPRFRLKKDGKEVIDTVVNLRILMPGVVDSFNIPEEGLRIKAEMFPDHYVENGAHKTKGRFPFNPALFVEIEKAGKMIGRGFLIKGQKVDVENYSLEFVELKNWMELIVSRDAGVPVITIGFIMISLGLLARFILNEKHLWVIMNEKDTGTAVGIGGRTRYFPAIFDEELKRLAEELKGR